MKTIGVLGVGSIADVYVRNAALMRNYGVVAVAGRDVARTRQRAGAWGVEADTPERLVRRDDIDVVLNLTPPTAHYATTMAALDAGKHVFCEKPLGISFAEACSLVEAADKHGLRLGVAPDTILGAGIQKARAMIDAGAIGQPLMATASILYHGADNWHPNPSFFYRASGGGPVHDVGPYFLAALMVLLGPVERVQATGFKGFATRTFTAEGPEKGLTVPVEVMTSVLALATFRSGVQAALTASWDVWQTSQPDLEIHGTLGSLSLPHPNWHGGPLKYARPGGGWEDIPLGDEPLAQLNWPPAAPERANYRGIGLAEMIDAIDVGRPHRTSAQLALHIVEAADAIVASAGSGGAVHLLSLQPQRPEPFSSADAAGLLQKPSETDYAPRSG
ncbi:MAG: Gfo/Idh/MocA family oxidoreductase [Bradyrhizobium sp.]|nr:Gfo/Idh/MocA family oxidoreductase [Bradyrhizobium sp.]